MSPNFIAILSALPLIAWLAIDQARCRARSYFDGPAATYAHDSRRCRVAAIWLLGSALAVAVTGTDPAGWASALLYGVLAVWFARRSRSAHRAHLLALRGRWRA